MRRPASIFGNVLRPLAIFSVLVRLVLRRVPQKSVMRATWVRRGRWGVSGAIRGPGTSGSPVSPRSGADVSATSPSEQICPPVNFERNICQGSATQLVPRQPQRLGPG
uniref:Putative secreted protein n=1 Tax=Ixodes ricinus TaxID=34613 RepID=A0A147BF06_IXORI